jgi:hypothetical protein
MHVLLFDFEVLDLVLGFWPCPEPNSCDLFILGTSEPQIFVG